MSQSLSPENEAFLAQMLSANEFPDREAVLDEAVGLLRRRREFVEAIRAGVDQLATGESQHYRPDELAKFLSDVQARETQRFSAK